MTFPSACAAMSRGEFAYRRGWKAGTFLGVRCFGGKHTLCRFVDNKPEGIWISEPGDLAADDWECEVFVSPVIQETMQPGA